MDRIVGGNNGPATTQQFFNLGSTAGEDSNSSSRTLQGRLVQMFRNGPEGASTNNFFVSRKEMELAVLRRLAATTMATASSSHHFSSAAGGAGDAPTDLSEVELLHNLKFAFHRIMTWPRVSVNGEDHFSGASFLYAMDQVTAAYKLPIQCHIQLLLLSHPLMIQVLLEAMAVSTTVAPTTGTALIDRIVSDFARPSSGQHHYTADEMEKRCGSGARISITVGNTTEGDSEQPTGFYLQVEATWQGTLPSGGNSATTSQEEKDHRVELLWREEVASPSWAEYFGSVAATTALYLQQAVEAMQMAVAAVTTPADEAPVGVEEANKGLLRLEEESQSHSQPDHPQRGTLRFTEATDGCRRSEEAEVEPTGALASPNSVLRSLQPVDGQPALALGDFVYAVVS